MEGKTVTGELTYFEIGVADAERARAFYGGLFDWGFEPAPSGNGYGISTRTVPGGMNESGVGASPQMYFSVPDIEAAMVRVRELGGHADTLESRAEVPEEERASFGRFALCRDDQGFRFGLHQPPDGS
jgi:predicted enzyme related to lactoylglutathione lyase